MSNELTRSKSLPTRKKLYNKLGLTVDVSNLEVPDRNPPSNINQTNESRFSAIEAMVGEFNSNIDNHTDFNAENPVKGIPVDDVNVGLLEVDDHNYDDVNGINIPPPLTETPRFAVVPDKDMILQSAQDNGIIKDKVFRRRKYVFIEKLMIRDENKLKDDENKLKDDENKLKDDENKLKDHENKLKDHENKLKDHENKLKDHENKLKDHENKDDETKFNHENKDDETKLKDNDITTNYNNNNVVEYHEQSPYFLIENNNTEDDVSDEVNKLFDIEAPDCVETSNMKKLKKARQKPLIEDKYEDLKRTNSVSSIKTLLQSTMGLMKPKVNHDKEGALRKAKSLEFTKKHSENSVSNIERSASILTELSAFSTGTGTTIDNSEDVQDISPLLAKTTALGEYLNNVGFLQGRFSDIVVSMNNQEFFLHTLILCRSPIINTVLSGKHSMLLCNGRVVLLYNESPRSLSIQISDDSDFVGTAIVLAMQTLYGAHQEFTFHNCFRYLLGGLVLDLPDLVTLAVDYMILSQDETNIVDCLGYYKHIQNMYPNSVLKKYEDHAYRLLMKMFRKYNSGDCIDKIASLPFYWFSNILLSNHLPIIKEYNRYLFLTKCCLRRLQMLFKVEKYTTQMWHEDLQNQEHPHHAELLKVAQVLRDGPKYATMSTADILKCKDCKILPLQVFKKQENMHRTVINLSGYLSSLEKIAEADDSKIGKIKLGDRFEFNGHYWQWYFVQKTVDGNLKLGIYIKQDDTQFETVGRDKMDNSKHKFQIYGLLDMGDSSQPIFESVPVSIQSKGMYGWLSDSLFNYCRDDRNDNIVALVLSIE
jgi:hypothetical protein